MLWSDGGLGRNARDLRGALHWGQEGRRETQALAANKQAGLTTGNHFTSAPYLNLSSLPVTMSSALWEHAFISS